MTTVDIDPFVPGFFLRPDYYDVLARLRAESPVHEVAPATRVISRYHDIREISRDTDRFRSGRGVLVNDPLRGSASEAATAIEGSILHMDPPRHDQWRRILNREFTGRAVMRMEPMLRRMVVDHIEAVPFDEEVDLVGMLTAPLPVYVIAELLGVPQDQRGDFRRWSDATIVATDGLDRMTAEDAQSVGELVAFLDAHARAMAEQPGDDVVSVLVQAEVDGRRLTPSELTIFGMSLLVAGNETTRHLMSGGIVALAEHPDARDRLAADPSLVPAAVEECLRWVTPIQQFCRTAVAPTEIAGVPIDEGDYLVMLYASGNRDESVFGPTASEFDPYRDVTTPNLAFGFGAHLCLGASLARLEARIFFEELLARRPDYTVAGPGEWIPSTLVRGPHALPVVFHSR